MPHHATLYFDECGLDGDDDDNFLGYVLKNFKPAPGFSYDAVLALGQIELYGPRLIELGFKLVHQGTNPNSDNECALFFKSEI